MHKTTYAMIRALLLVAAIMTGMALCIIEHSMKYPEYSAADCIEPATAASEPSEPSETEAPTDTTAREAEPAAATEPPTEPEHSEAWESLGTFTLTAYCPCEKCCGYWATIRPTDETGAAIVYTSTGEIARAGTTIAVDPSVIPYGSTVKINGHTYIAQDTGGAIRSNRIDVYFADHQEALEFGRQKAEVFLKTYIP